MASGMLPIEPIATVDELLDQRFGIAVADDRDGDVHVTRRARLGTGRNREPADQCPALAEVVEISGQAAQRSLQARHCPL